MNTDSKLRGLDAHQTVQVLVLQNSSLTNTLFSHTLSKTILHICERSSERGFHSCKSISKSPTQEAILQQFSLK